MKIKRLLAFILAALMLLSAAACSETTGDTPPADEDTTAGAADTETQAEETTEFNPFAALPAEDYEKYEFRFLNGNNASWYSRTSVIAEEMSGEPVNDAVFERESKVEAQFNVSVIETVNSDVVVATRNSIQSGSDDFDVSLITLMNVYAIASEGLFLDFHSIPNLDLTAPWWDQNAVKDMSVGGKLYFCTSDFDTTRFDGIRSLYFNKELISSFSLENPYVLVDENRWTFDKYIEMASAVSDDLDGDAKWTDQDRYGIVSYSDIIVDMLTYGAGFKYLAKDADDLIIFTGTDSSHPVYSEAYYTVYDKIREIFNTDGLLFNVRTVDASYKRGLDDRIQEQLFLENKALFYSECMAWTRVLREMEADFGVLPPPKSDPSQERYYSVIINPFVQTIPKTTKDTARTGVLLEALAAASHDTVVPAYVDITLTGKVARDPDTVRMLAFVFDQLAYNIHLGEVNIRNTVITQAVANAESLASSFAKTEKSYTKQLPKVLDKFAAIEG